MLSIPLLAISVAAAGIENPEEHSCKADFYKHLDAGQINSVNGLAIYPQFAGFLFTEMFDGRARIVERKCENGRLQETQPVFRDHGYHDYQPTLSLDSERLCFTSTRPVSGSAPARQNIWCATKQSGWSDAAPISRLISPYWDGHAVEVAHQKILFASERPADGQMVDIFEFDLADDQSTPKRVSSLNSKTTDNDMAFDRHSRTLIFSRYDPETEDIDLYVSFQEEGVWTPAERISRLASPEWQLSPAITPDGEYLLYMIGGKPFRRVLMLDVISSIRD